MPVNLHEGAARCEARTEAMRLQNDDPPQDETARGASARPSVSHRPEGQAQALERAATYRGFTKTIPTVERAYAVLQATARRDGLRAATHALMVLLRCLPRWREDPMLRLSNPRIGDAAGCASRTVQRHLKALHEQGVIGVTWGPGNTRLPWRHDGHGRPEPIGIDLRPALVFAQEMAALRRAGEATLHAFRRKCHATDEAMLAARSALGGWTRLTPSTEIRLRDQLAGLRRRGREATRQAHSPAATPAAIAAATQAMAAIGAEAAQLCRMLEQDRDPGPGSDGEGAGKGSPGASPDRDSAGDQGTVSTHVEGVVPTIRESGSNAAQRWGSLAHGQGRAWDTEAGHEDLAGPLLYTRWRAAHDGTAPLPSGDLVELEIAARRRTTGMGMATWVLNEAIERHGIGLVIGAVLHVSTPPERARVRSRGGLLASLLRRELGELAPATFHRRPPTDPDLGEADALGLARRLAPLPRPPWVLTRWHATRRPAARARPRPAARGGGATCLDTRPSPWRTATEVRRSQPWLLLAPARPRFSSSSPKSAISRRTWMPSTTASRSRKPPRSRSSAAARWPTRWSTRRGGKATAGRRRGGSKPSGIALPFGTARC